MSASAGTGKDPAPAGDGAPVVAAAIDVGSNSVLLLAVATGEDGRGRAVDEAVETTRLGTGLTRGGRLDPAARARTRDAVGRFAARARAAGARWTWAFATGAVRDASDGADFARELHETTGVPVEVLTGEAEARLAFGAVTHAFDLPGSLLAVDVGGRTTELTLGSDGRPADMVSVPLGALALTEQVAHEPGERLQEAIDEILAGLDLLAGARRTGARTIVSGGTATAVAALDLALTAYDPRRVHGHQLPAASLRRLADWLAAMPVAARGRLPGLEPGRGAIVFAGALVLQRLAAVLGDAPLMVSGHGVRHAYLRDRLGAGGIRTDFRALWT